MRLQQRNRANASQGVTFSERSFRSRLAPAGPGPTSEKAPTPPLAFGLDSLGSGAARRGGRWDLFGTDVKSHPRLLGSAGITRGRALAGLGRLSQTHVLIRRQSEAATDWTRLGQSRRDLPHRSCSVTVPGRPGPSTTPLCRDRRNRRRLMGFEFIAFGPNFERGREGGW